MAKKRRQKPADNQRKQASLILWFSDIGIADTHLVGAKHATLGEMHANLTKQGIAIPFGFAITTSAYKQFIAENGLEAIIKKAVKHLDIDDVTALAKAGKTIRQAIKKATFSSDLQERVLGAYKELQNRTKEKTVAIRSSVAIDGVPEETFAGKHENYLHIRGDKQVLAAVKKCMASLFTDRAIAYREQRGYDHLLVAVSVSVQQMIHANDGVSGILCTVDRASGFDGIMTIHASYGLGEYVVQGKVDPDQLHVYKEGVKQGKTSIISRFIGTKKIKLGYGKTSGTKQVPVKKYDQEQCSIDDKDVMTLSEWGMMIEQYFEEPQHIEWVKDGKTGKIYIVQARPELIKARINHNIIETYHLNKEGKEVCRGEAIGKKIGAGRVRIIDTPQQRASFRSGDVLVMRSTSPEFEPIMRLASAIVTEQEGATSHAAIVARELGIPCIVGVKEARAILTKHKHITVCGANEQAGIIYKGILPFEVHKEHLQDIPSTKTKVMVNIANPDNAYALSFLPHDGVGLVREEFIFSEIIRIHPLALVHYDKLKDKKTKKEIAAITKQYKQKTAYLVDTLAQGIAKIAASASGRDVILRLSDFKTNEYANLIGGKEFEPQEENPMLGWRGASRYYSKEYKKAFELECQAIKKVRDEWGLTNVIVMVPFCRTPEEGKKVLETMETFGLKRKENGLQVYVMCEIPSNVILAQEFATLFDGFSIGSNDLTQLALGIDKDTVPTDEQYSENNDTVKTLIRDVIKVAHKQKKAIGVCGQAASEYPEFTEFLVQEGVDSISLNPDTLIDTKKRIAALEKTVGRTGRKKTHKTYVSMIAAFGIMAAAMIGIGAGCASPIDSVYDVGDATDYISPAQIRERATQQALIQKEGEYQKQTTTLMIRDFADFVLDYPIGWTVEHWNGGVTLRGEQGTYVSVYKQLVSLPVEAERTRPTRIGGYAARALPEVILADESRRKIYEVDVGPETIIVVEAAGDMADQVVESMSFVTSSNAITDRPLNHWDIREGRVCTQVVTYARASTQDSCRPFPTPCDVPDNWEVCDGGDLSE